MLLEGLNDMKKINYYPGHMAKTKRLIKTHMKHIDIILEVLDARAPYASINPELKELFTYKPKLLLLNKSDLAEQKPLHQWMETFESHGYHTLKINALKGTNVDEIHHKAKTILKDVFEKEQTKGRIERPIRALIVGIPNVGKSTLINRLVGKKATKIGDTPGITRHLQTIRINKDFELLDTPGILWPNITDQQSALNLALLGTIKDHFIPRDDVVIHGFDILKNHYKDAFEKKYDMDIDEADTSLDLFEKIAKKRGCLMQGGQIDYERVMDHFLYDFRHQGFGPIILERVSSRDVQL